MRQFIGDIEIDAVSFKHIARVIPCRCFAFVVLWSLLARKVERSFVFNTQYMFLFVFVFLHLVKKDDYTQAKSNQSCLV